MFTEFKLLLRSLTGENTVIDLEEEFKEEELGPPEQYIEFLLKDHGGHLRQQEILTAVEWSAGTVSRKLSWMEE